MAAAAAAAWCGIKNGWNIAREGVMKGGELKGELVVQGVVVGGGYMVGGGVVCTGDPLDRLEVGVGGGELCPIRWWLPGSGVSVTLISGLSAPSRQGGGELGTTLTTPWSMLIIVLQL